MIDKRNNEKYYKRTFAKKCTYKGYEFDSQMEMHFAMFLDGQMFNYKGTNYYHKPIRWERERFKFAIIPRQIYFDATTNEYEFLDDYIYTPDFYIPELNKFIEIKGFSGDTPEWKLRKRLFLHCFSSKINFYTLYHHSDFNTFETHSESIINGGISNKQPEQIYATSNSKKGCVYMHAFPNGKVYIGQTTQSPNARWQYGKGYPKKYNPYLYNAIQKYGWDNIEHIILADNLDCVERNKLETYYIEKYNSNCYEFGYNLTRGGDYHTIDMASRMNFCNPVICHETQIIYTSPIVVDRAFNISGVSNICNGSKSKTHYAKGYHWWYFNDYIKLSQEDIERVINSNNNYCRVICLTTGKVYNSSQEAAKDIGLTPSMISYSCKTNKPVGIKYIIKHYEYIYKANKQVKAIKVIEDDKIFTTYKAMIEYYGVTLETIKRYEKDKYFRMIDKNSGYIFKKLE